MSAPGAPSNLARKVVRGVAWTLPTSLGSRLIGLVGTLVLARYLAPAEYGEVSAAAIVTLTAASVTTFGVGLYLITNKEISREEGFHVTCWFLASGAVALTAVWWAAGPLGRWLGAPEFRTFMPVLLASTVLERLLFIPERMLVRQLRFRWLSIARALAELTFTGVSVTLAARGEGAMAVAWGNLARSGLRFVTVVPAVDLRDWLEPHRLRLATMLRVIRFGLNVSVTSIATFAMRRWDNLLVSRLFGPAVMGGYNYAYNLADTPAVAIGEPMSDVISASLPHVQQQNRKAALVRSCTMTSLVMFPLTFGLAAVAPTIVATFFDARWSSVGEMLMLLSVLSATRPMAHILVSYFYARQRPTAVLWLEWSSLVAIIVSISTVGRLGIHWTCAAVGGVFVLRTFAALWAVRRMDGFAISDFVSPLVMPTLACLVMVGVILVVRPSLHGLSPAIRLGVEVPLGALVYLAGALLLFRATAVEFLGTVGSAVSGRREAGLGAQIDGGAGRR